MIKLALLILILILILIFVGVVLIRHGRKIVDNISAPPILIGNEKWIVSVSKWGHEDLVIDKFYLYTHDFIYGDLKQQKRFNYKIAYTSQNVGIDKEKCKIVLSGPYIADFHGKISFFNDYGLVYRDNLNEKSKDYRACLNAPFCEEGHTYIDGFTEIYDGIKIYIGRDNVLLFTKDSQNFCNEDSSSKKFKWFDDLSASFYSFIKNLDSVLNLEEKPDIFSKKGNSETKEDESNG